jgi:flagellar biosynthesis/type III secretory pathway chaperone
MPNAETAALPLKIMGIIAELDSVLETEIGLLEKFQYTKHPELLRRKQELTLHYQNSLKDLSSLPEKKTILTDDVKARLTEAGKRLETTTRRNADAIRAAQYSTEHLLDSVMKEIKKEISRESGYSKGAVLTTEERAPTRPVALNQRI